MDKVKPYGAVVVAVVTAAIAVWWLALVAQRLNVMPKLDDKGAVVLDEFQRAKDVLLVVLPLFTAVVAFFVGNQGTADAKKEATGARKQLQAVVDSAPIGTLQQAKSAHPDAFV
ncbi:MAG: hypothetical protein ACYDH6_03100 [Acidimicrobiales bacterium]